MLKTSIVKKHDRMLKSGFPHGGVNKPTALFWLMVDSEDSTFATEQQTEKKDYRTKSKAAAF